MPSTKNPNQPSRDRLVARAAKARQAQQKRSAAGKSRVDKADTKRGARPGLLPTSGPRAPLSSKKKRKLEKQLAHALRRKMAAEGEVVMKEAPKSTNQRKQSPAASDDKMELDTT